MANGNGKLQIRAVFDIQTSYGCLKVSEFYQESDSEDKNKDALDVIKMDSLEMRREKLCLKF